MDTLEGKITITRRNVSKGSDYINISIRDNLSSIEFVDIDISFASFAEAITGRGFVPCSLKVNHLDCVGKKYEGKRFEFEMPEHSLGNRKDIANQTAKELCPDGWIPRYYFGSQDSFFEKDGKKYARCYIERWLDE